MPALYETLGHDAWQVIRLSVGAPPLPALTTTKPKVSLLKKPVTAGAK